MLEKLRRSQETSLYVSRWRVVRDGSDQEDTRDPLAPDWWISDDEASGQNLAAMGIDLAALDAELLAQAAAREAED